MEYRVLCHRYLENGCDYEDGLSDIFKTGGNIVIYHGLSFCPKHFKEHKERIERNQAKINAMLKDY